MLRNRSFKLVEATSRAIFALCVLAVTANYYAQQKLLTERSIEITKINGEFARVSTEPSIVAGALSEDPKRRELSLYMAREINPELAARIALVLASDNNATVRQGAERTLATLSGSPRPEIRVGAESSLAKVDLAAELKHKRLLKELDSADNYVAGGNVTGKERAVEIYKRVVDDLSPAARRGLDPSLFKEAQRSSANHFTDSAAVQYRALFGDVPRDGQ